MNHRIFYQLLGNTLVASVTNAFVWFSLTFWVFLETRSVLATSLIAGTFAVMNMCAAFFFGQFVDRHKKRTAMVVSSIVSLSAYLIGAAILFFSAEGSFSSVRSVELWFLIVVLMTGSVAGNLRMIALSTTITFLFTEGRDKANGMVGAVNGIGFSLTSILSGLAIGFYDMKFAISCAVAGTIVALFHIVMVDLKEPAKTESHVDERWHDTLHPRAVLAVIATVPGLLALIFFTTFNNFLGGVFMALMDAYGLSLVSVETWGLMFAVLSFGFILGSSYIAKYGLGKNPLRAMLLVNVITWTTCIFFTIQPSVILLGAGMLIWMSLVPFIEATEQTVIQKVVPYEKQGRVFGFAQSVESAATPVTAFLIGPVAQFVFIPFMTDGQGVEWIGDWFGTGPDRGIALVFTLAGVIGLLVTLVAFRSHSYRLLSNHYAELSELKTK